MEDPSLGPFDEGQVQIHDINPGDLNEPDLPNLFSEGGVFWTQSIPEASVVIGPEKGDASFSLSDFPLLDFFDAANALFRGGQDAIPSTASLNISWTGTGEVMEVHNTSGGFVGEYANATPAFEWSVTNDEGFSLSTADSSETNVTHAFTAQIQNGVFIDSVTAVNPKNKRATSWGEVKQRR